MVQFIYICEKYVVFGIKKAFIKCFMNAFKMLPDKDSNQESPKSDLSVLPITPSGNDGCKCILFSFSPKNIFLFISANFFF